MNDDVFPLTPWSPAGDEKGAGGGGGAGVGGSASGTATGSNTAASSLISTMSTRLFLALPVAAQEPERPNVVLIISDDQGWMDIGYNGSEIRTPSLDRLVADGVRLERFYVYPMCSPTRVGLISGRAPSRYGILGAIGYRSRQALPPETLA